MTARPSTPTPPAIGTIADVVRRQAVTRPRDVAFVCAGQIVTWAELDHRTDALASSLGATLRAGDRVAVLTQACHRHWEAIFACAKAGLVAVPLNYRWLPHEVADALSDCGATALVVDLALPQSRGASSVLSHPSLRLVVGFGGLDARAADYEAIVAGRGQAPTHPPSRLNVIGYTSGTTGKAKGAAATHASAMASALWFAALFGLRAGDTFLACMPVYVYRGAAAGLAPMVVGARSLMLDFDVQSVLAAVVEERVTHAVLAPIMVDRLLAHPDVARVDLTSLRGLWIGGAPSSPSSIRRLQAIVGDIVGSVYGMTEAVGIASMRWPTTDDDRLRSVGRDSPLIDVRLVGPDGVEAAPGAPGELYVRGDTVMAGYWPDVDGGGLHDGWYATGDIGRRDEDGYLFLVDRRADIVNSGGLNVYTLEVEEALVSHPAVTSCAVIGTPDSVFGEAVAAFVEVDAAHNPSVADLAEHCRSALAGYKCPRQISIVDALPRNAMGKVDKVALRRAAWAEADRRIAGG